MFGLWKNRSRLAGAGVMLAALYLLLLLPDAPPPSTSGAGQQPFTWARDTLWQKLEADLRTTRKLNPTERATQYAAALTRVNQLLAQLATTNLPPTAVEWDALETEFFACAGLAAANPERSGEFQQVAARLGEIARQLLLSWPADTKATRQRSYRLLFGRRAALEEVMLQPASTCAPLELVALPETNATPAAEVAGVRIHSGDILVSRGGAATSALIARGNDYPGNFSHVALVHIAEDTGEISVIESRIECGVSVRPIADYLADTKLRIMVLRWRDVSPGRWENPQLPHLAACSARKEARARHIPYDFAMDHAQPDGQFCSEVVAHAYQHQGVRLWSVWSQVSAPGTVRWLTALGVRNFTSLQPSDLEYDPQLTLVAEWRNPETLWQDHLDNAVTDALLAQAERGAALAFNRWMLPPTRLLKAGCWLLNRFGLTGPIPEGMSATTALRVRDFKARHAGARERLREAAAEFQRTEGYRAPYWELVRLAHAAVQTH